MLAMVENAPATRSTAAPIPANPRPTLSNPALPRRDRAPATRVKETLIATMAAEALNSCSGLNWPKATRAAETMAMDIARFLNPSVFTLKARASKYRSMLPPIPSTTPIKDSIGLLSASIALATFLTKATIPTENKMAKSPPGPIRFPQSMTFWNTSDTT